jgi:hypothetical protein
MTRQVLFLGSPKQNSVWIDFCIKAQIPFVSISLKEPTGQSNFPKRLKKELPYERVAELASYILPLNSDLESIVHFLRQKQFTPTFIVCSSEVPLYVDLEEQLNQWYDTDTRACKTAIEFFKYKSVQDAVCQQLSFPTIPKTGEHGLCVKRDAKNFTVKGDIPKYRWEPSDYQPRDGEFTQAWIEKDYNLGLRVYADDVGNWHLLTTSKFFYVKGVHSHMYEPYNLNEWETEQCLKHIRGLCNHLVVRNRLLHIELLKPKDEQILYHMDFNCRHGGYIQQHRNDQKTLEMDYAEMYLHSKPPPHSQMIFRTRRCDFFFQDHHHRLTTQQIKRIVFYEDPALVMRNNWSSCDKFSIIRYD